MLHIPAHLLTPTPTPDPLVDIQRQITGATSLPLLLTLPRGTSPTDAPAIWARVEAGLAGHPVELRSTGQRDAGLSRVLATTVGAGLVVVYSAETNQPVGRVRLITILESYPAVYQTDDGSFRGARDSNRAYGEFAARYIVLDADGAPVRS